MSASHCLPESFYNRSSIQVAQELLGMKLVRLIQGERLEGLIIETEAYRGEEDLASHAHFGRTLRNAVMYGPPGRAYVYFTYGVHWMLNCVCEDEGVPAAVLIRALLPTRGLDEMARRRPGRPPGDLASGPAKLCQALAVDGSLNGADLTDPAGVLYIEPGTPPPAQLIQTSPRIGIKYAPEPWLSQPWRFYVAADVFQNGRQRPA